MCCSSEIRAYSDAFHSVTASSCRRLADLIAAYPPARLANGKLPRYVYMETPDGDYYCGYDMAVALHPQSLLVYEMGGRPITRWHGAPLRLHTPLKYGYKQVRFT